MESYLPRQAASLGASASHRRTASVLASPLAVAPSQRQPRPGVAGSASAREHRFFANLPIQQPRAVVNTSGMSQQQLQASLSVASVVAPVAQKAETATSKIGSAVVPLLQASHQAHAENKALREAQAEVQTLRSTVSELNKRLVLAGDRIAVLGHNRASDVAAVAEESKTMRARVEALERDRSSLETENLTLTREVAEVKSKMLMAGEKMFEVQTSVVGESRVLHEEIEKLRAKNNEAERRLEFAAERLEQSLQEASAVAARESIASGKLAELTTLHETAIEALLEASSYRQILEEKLKRHHLGVPSRPEELVELFAAVGMPVEDPLVQAAESANEAPIAPRAESVGSDASERPQSTVAASTPSVAADYRPAPPLGNCVVSGSLDDAGLKLAANALDFGKSQHPVKGSFYMETDEAIDEIGTALVMPGCREVANTSGQGGKNATVMQAVVKDFSTVFFVKPLFSRRQPLTALLTTAAA